MGDTNLKRVAADIEGELCDEMDELGEVCKLKRAQIIAEAVERFMPILRERAAERRQVRSAAMETAAV